MKDREIRESEGAFEGIVEVSDEDNEINKFCMGAIGSLSELSISGERVGGGCQCTLGTLDYSTTDKKAVSCVYDV